MKNEQIAMITKKFHRRVAIKKKPATTATTIHSAYIYADIQWKFKAKQFEIIYKHMTLHKITATCDVYHYA